MISDSRPVALPKAQAACLVALRMDISSVTEIATRVGLAENTTSRALSVLSDLGLAERSRKKGWRPTALGATCELVIPVRAEADAATQNVSRNGRRLLELLERPLLGSGVAEKLGLTRQGATYIIRRLYARGCLKFADPDDPSWWILRADDPTVLLTRDQELVLSAMPHDYATTVKKLHRRTTLPEERVDAALRALIGSGLVEAAGEFNGAALFRATAASLGHPQNRPDVREAEPPTLPVYSDRVLSYLSAIEQASPARIKDLGDALGWPLQATNALTQYLKRRGLVRKTGGSLSSPYELTELGRLTLSEMEQPGRIKVGYAAGAVISQSANMKTPKAGKSSRAPIRSGRGQAVLAIMSEAGALRIKDISDRLRLPLPSTNSLIQYLKGKALVQKTGERLGDPYALTPLGRSTLAAMEGRRAA